MEKSEHSSEYDEGPAFWRFSVEVYGRPGASEACLTLQDAHGADVNLALFALWSGMSAGRLPGEAVAAARALAEAWSARAVRPLRAVRRDLKAGVAALDDAAAVAAFRERVKALELEAERVEQFALAGLAASATGPAGAEAARANIRALQPAFGPEALALFDVLIKAAA